MAVAGLATLEPATNPGVRKAADSLLANANDCSPVEERRHLVGALYDAAGNLSTLTRSSKTLTARWRMTSTPTTT